MTSFVATKLPLVPLGFRRVGFPLVTAVCLLLAVLVCVDTALSVIHAYRAVPFGDQWEPVDQYDALLAGRLSFMDIFSQHNEHRIAIPRLFFLVDFLFFHGNNAFNIASTFVVQLFSVWILLRLHAAASRPRTAGFTIVAATTVILLLCLSQYENFIWGFQVQFVGVYAAAAASFWLFAIAAARAREGRPCLAPLSAAMLLLFVATFSMSNGVLAGLVLVAIGLLLRAPRALILAVGAETLALAALYAIHYVPVAGHTPMGYALQHPIEYLEYIAAYLGNPLAFLTHPGAILLGAWGMVATVAVFWQVVYRGTHAAPAALFGILLFVGVTAAATAVGRMSFGIDQAFSSRYVTPASIFWATQLIYWFSAARSAPFASFIRAALATTGAVLVVGACWAQVHAQKAVSAYVRGLDLGTDALLTGVNDYDALEHLATVPSTFLREVPFLKSHGLSVFSLPEAKWLGSPLARVAAVAPSSACTGGFDAVESVPETVTPGDAEVAGWGWNVLHKKRVERVIVVGQDDEIVGLASAGWPLPPGATKTFPAVRRAAGGWRGFARGVGDGSQLRAFGFVDRGVACELGTIRAQRIQSVSRPQGLEGVTFPPPVEVPMARVGGIIPAAAATKGAWRLNGQDPMVGGLPDGAQVFGSWVGADANMGVLTFGPFTPKSDSFVLPLVTGPDTHGLAISVVDASNDLVLVSFRPRVRREWSWLVITLPASPTSHPIRLVVTDHGADWGEWLAVGAPRALAPMQ
jgi:hypothetical protein